MANQVPRNAALIAVPLVFVALALVQRSRSKTAQPMAKTGAKKHRPKSLLRYYVIGGLIGALERDSTRKAVIATLKLAQRRA